MKYSRIIILNVFNFLLNNKKINFNNINEILFYKTYL